MSNIKGLKTVKSMFGGQNYLYKFTWGIFYSYRVYSPEVLTVSANSQINGMTNDLIRRVLKKSQGKNDFRKQKSAEMRLRVRAQNTVSILTTGKLMNVFSTYKLKSKKEIANGRRCIARCVAL